MSLYNRAGYALLRTAGPVLRHLPRSGDRLLGVFGDPVPTPPYRMGRLGFGPVFVADLRDRIQRQMYYLGWYEREESHWLLSELRPGDTFFDVGAHIGYHTLLASTRVGIHGRVHAFEPYTLNYDDLCTNLRVNQCLNATAINRAVSDATGPTRFRQPETDGERGWGALDGSAGSSVQVPAISLDDYVLEQGIKRVDGVKVDVEGAEGLVLNGMERILSTMPPRFIMMEAHALTLSRFGVAVTDLVEALRARGYRARRITRPGSRDTAETMSNVAFTLPGG